MLFVSTQNFVSVSSGLGGCGSKKLDIPSKYIRYIFKKELTIGCLSCPLNICSTLLYFIKITHSVEEPDEAFMIWM